MSADCLELPQGTLDLLSLKTVALEPQHGWAISQRLHQLSSATWHIHQGSLCPLCIASSDAVGSKRSGASNSNCRPKYYEVTRRGRTQLETETTARRKLSAAIGQALESA
jgi:DNA-binding PadR family transcriptional regulator